MKRYRCLPFVFAVLACTVLAPRQGGAFAWNMMLRNEDMEPLVQIRLAALRGDKSKVPDLITQLQHPPGVKAATYMPGSRYHNQRVIHDYDIDNYQRLVLMHALAQMGAAGAMPEMDNIIQNNKDRSVVA